MALNLNRASLSLDPLNTSINALIECAVANEARDDRGYLGASSIGAECLRKVQYDWLCEPKFKARTKNIFERGHFFESLARKRLLQAGFRFRAPASALGFTSVNGLFQGHCDGIIDSGPEIPGLAFPCVWECKGLGDSGWKSLEREGLDRAYPAYAAQVSIYQAYLDVADNPGLFTAINANTCELLHFAVPFNAERAQAWSDRAVKIIEATRAHQLLDRVAKKSDDWRCRMCSHKERCWE